MKATIATVLELVMMESFAALKSTNVGHHHANTALPARIMSMSVVSANTLLTDKFTLNGVVVAVLYNNWPLFRVR